MQYRRMPIEIEAPEGMGYENIECNLSESSYTDQRLEGLGLSIHTLLLHYGDHKGKPALRELIAHIGGFVPDDVLITPGAAAALFIVATSLLDKGDQIIVAKPNYATNIETPLAIGADISYLNLRFGDRYRLDLDELAARLTAKTKLVSLTYPHNPTGVMIDLDTLLQVIRLVERNGSYLLMDETCRDMCFVPQLPVAASLSDSVISVSSMSKSYGPPGIRIGWLICRNKRLMETFLAAKEQIFITNSVLDEEVAFQYLLNKEKLFGPVRANILHNFGVLKNFMQGQDLLEWVEPQGGCVCFPRIREGININISDFYDALLNKYGTYVGRDGWFDEDDRYMRIGYGWETSGNIKKGLRNIIQTISEIRIA
jgi:aspartate/methionine/tyrosine aminotransferase